MNSTIAFTVLLSIFGIGDIVANKTKATISMILFVAVAMLAGFWSGILPQTLIADSNVASLGRVAAGLLVVSLGTMLNLSELISQWKTVTIGVLAVAILSIFVYFFAGPIIGRDMAIAGAPVLSGGSAATLIMTTALTEKGLEQIAVFCVLLYVTQKFLGVPIASFMLKKEANRVLGLYKSGAYKNELENNGKGKEISFRILPEMKKELQTPFVLMAKTASVVVLSNFLAELTAGKVNAFVLYLVLGVIFTEIGYLEKDILKKANANGFIMLLAMTVIFANLTKATPEMVASFIGPALITVAFGFAGVAITSIVAAKVLKFTPALGISIGVSCFFGFPATYYLSHEVANAVGETEEEQKVLLDHILPKMLVAGFTTVTIASVVFAGIMINLL